MAEGGIVVAICQYGGEFTSGPNGNLIYIGGEAHAVDVSREMSLDSFKDEVSKVFHVDVTDMSFKYFLPNNNRTLITISCDRDLQRMVEFTASAAQADVFVISRVENRSIVTYTGASTVKARSTAHSDKRKRPASKNKASKSSKKTPDARGAAVQANTVDVNEPRPVVTLNDYNEYRTNLYIIAHLYMYIVPLVLLPIVRITLVTIFSALQKHKTANLDPMLKLFLLPSFSFAALCTSRCYLDGFMS